MGRHGRQPEQSTSTPQPTKTKLRGRAAAEWEGETGSNPLALARVSGLEDVEGGERGEEGEQKSTNRGSGTDVGGGKRPNEQN